ncbi:MAG: alginate export family protein [Candidatus Omnitrophica bacterium]|nr:alginate export family protein [Candidatus Omnitrophota bacterium]MDD5591689.1 alginate export family protein [Candidatus Omnitrophota bacterium]
MSKRLILILALAFVVGITFAAYAEVQNVKVSGDITVSAVGRDNYDLAKSLSGNAIINSNFEDKDRDILSITRVRVDADLTDNVSATVRLLNERPWNGESRSEGQANRNIGLTASNTAAEANEIDLDLAYVTLKEFLYSPLSLSIGRQELHFGNDLIVGDPDTNGYSLRTALSEGDLSARKSFDALRATLDYNPIVVDLVYARTEAGAANLHANTDLAGINASYALNNNTTIEGFFFSKMKGSNTPAVYNVDAADNTGWTGAAVGAGLDNQNYKDRSDIVNTLGVRAVDKTVKNLTLDGQIAWQFGRYNPKFDPNARYDAASFVKAQTVSRNAWAAQLMGSYDLKDIAMLSKYSPSISASYTYLSGADRDQTTKRSYKGWDPMFENQTIGQVMNGIFADTNMHKAGLSAKAKLTDDIGAKLDYVGAWFAKSYPGGDNHRKAILSGYAAASGTAGDSGRQFYLLDGNYIGSEVDATLTYDYTEDVQFSLLGGVFFVGKNIRDADHIATKDNKANAAELIGSMKVTF